MAQRLEVFETSGSIFLGIAYIWDQPEREGYKWYSLLWRWNRNGFVLLEDDTAMPGAGFQLYQVLPTDGASDLEFVDAGPNSQLLIVSNLLSPTKQASFASSVGVWMHYASQWNPLVRAEAGVFQLLQTIPAIGVQSLHAFSVPGLSDGVEHVMLGLSKMRSAPGNYTSASTLYKWDLAKQRFTVHQELPNRAVAAMALIREGEEAHLVLVPMTFGKPECGVLPVGNVSGGNESFGNETAGNASFGNASAGNNSGGNTSSPTHAPSSPPEPEHPPVGMAEILQWDRPAQRFDILMSITDTEYARLHGRRVPGGERRIHEQALPLPVESSVDVSVVFTPGGGPVLLVFSSLVDGTVLLEWDFERAVGLEGARALVADPTGDAVFVAGGETSSISLISRSDEPDARGGKVMSLTWREAWSEDVLPISRMRAALRHGADGLASAKRIFLTPPGCSIASPGESSGGEPHACAGLIVEADPPRHNLPCGPTPPVRPPVGDANAALPPLLGAWVPPRCVTPGVSVTQLETSDAGLLSDAPGISDGVLKFAARDLHTGTAVFSAVSTPGSGIPRPFSVTVLPLRYIPSFSALFLEVNEAKLPSEHHMLKFAADLSTGDQFSTLQDLRSLEWVVTNETRCPDAYGDAPTLIIISLSISLADGMGYGVVRFRWLPAASGVCEIEVVLRDGAAELSSLPHTFTITAHPVNDPPILAFASACMSSAATNPAFCRTVEIEGVALPGVEVLQGAGMQRVRVLQSITWAPDARPEECSIAGCGCGPQGFCRQVPGCGDEACWYTLNLISVEKGTENPGVVVGYPEWDDNLTSPYFATTWADDPSIFLSAEMFPSGEMAFEAAPERFGVFRLTIKAVDKLGGARGGVDSSVVSLLVNIVPVVVPVRLEFALAPLPSTDEDASPVDATPAAPRAPLDVSALVDALLGALRTQALRSEEEAALAARSQPWQGLDLTAVKVENVSDANITVVEMKVATEQVYNAFFSGISNGPPEQQALSSLAVTVGNTTRNALFVHNDVGDCTGCPTLTMRLTGDAADLTFTLEPFRYGVATVPVTFVSTAPWSTEGASLSLELDIIVLPVNDPPMANVPVWIGIAEDSEPLQLADFVTGITVGPANEGWQRPIFTVQSAPDTPGLLAAMEGYELGAAISSAGTLALAVASGLHGVITLTIGLRDSGGSALGGLEHAVNFPKVAHVKVFPRPRITSVTPCVGPFGAGRTVTIFGQYFGSDYTAPPTGYDQEALSITVGDEACEDVQFMSDTKILCRLPYGQGRRAVTVTLHGGTANNMLGAPLSNWSRSASLATGVEAVQVLYGGGVVSASSPSRSSLLALGPVTETATDAELLEMRTCVEWNVTESTAGTDTTVGTDATRVCTRIGWNRNYSAPTARVVSGLPTVKSIRAIAHYKGRVYLGGSFTLDDSFQHRSKFYLATWDGSQLQSVGAGLEGTLYALEPFMGGLVVAGAFLQVYPDGDTSSPGIRTGGLASWDGTRWSLVGSQPLMGVVTCAAAVGDRLYVAGRFSTVGDVRASNIAQFDGSAWTPLGTGLVSRDVWSIAANDVGVFVGGDFTIAGGVAVLNLARWDPARAEWTGMRAINGVVRALAAFGARLFVAGDFSMAGTTPVTSIAQYSAVATGDVQWVPVGAGVIGGSVFSMRKIKDCIYIGGVFSAVADTDGVKPAENVARWCVNATHRASERFDPVRGVSLPGAQVLAIAEMADEI